MARHDYLCACGTVLRDQVRSVDEGAQANPPYCPTCGLRMGWIPQISRMDILSDGTSGAKFVQFDGQNRPVLVDSFTAMHRLEVESEQQARNGEGQPIRFRALHQRTSEMDVNTFGDGPVQRPTAGGKAKFGFQGAARRLPGEPDVTFGPGVNESNTSALKDPA